MSDPNDANLQLKKRARRRLVGAVAFAGLAAVVLPMVMDEEPKQQVQDVQIRIPGQDQTPFNAKLVKPAPVASAKSAVAEQAEPAAEPPAAAVVKPAEVAPAKAAEKKPEAAKSEPAARLSTEKAKAANTSDAKHAADILAGKTVGATPVAGSGSGQYVILIGAFANPANVKQLQGKIGDLGIKVFTESLDAPDGKKTRVRAGPFASPEAAAKALEKMKRIGVNGVVVARQ